jgi:hypothetical protein
MVHECARCGLNAGVVGLVPNHGPKDNVCTTGVEKLRLGPKRPDLFLECLYEPIRGDSSAEQTTRVSAQDSVRGTAKKAACGAQEARSQAGVASIRPNSSIGVSLLPQARRSRSRSP